MAGIDEGIDAAVDEECAGVRIDGRLLRVGQVLGLEFVSLHCILRYYSRYTRFTKALRSGTNPRSSLALQFIRSIDKNGLHGTSSIRRLLASASAVLEGSHHVLVGRGYAFVRLRWIRRRRRPGGSYSLGQERGKSVNYARPLAQTD